MCGTGSVGGLGGAAVPPAQKTSVAGAGGPAVPPANETKTPDAQGGAPAKDAAVGAAGGGPTATPTEGVAQLTGLDAILQQLTKLIESLKALLGSSPTQGGGPVQQGEPAQGMAAGAAAPTISGTSTKSHCLSGGGLTTTSARRGG